MKNNETLFNVVLEKRLIKLLGKINGVTATMLVDSGASDSFVSSTCINQNGIRTTKSSADGVVVLADGTRHPCNGLVQGAQNSVGPYEDRIDLRAIALGKYDVVLGMPWLSHVNPTIDWKTETVRVMHKNPHRSYTTVPASFSNSPSSLNFISAKQIRKQKTDITDLFVVYVSSKEDDADVTTVCNAVEYEASPAVVKQLLTEYSDVFPHDLPAGLPPRRTIDHKIGILPDSSTPCSTMYRMSPSELDELKKQIQHLVSHGFIRPSKSSCGAPVLFVKKKDGSMRMCIDYRALITEH